MVRTAVSGRTHVKVQGIGTEVGQVLEKPCLGLWPDGLGTGGDKHHVGSVWTQEVGYEFAKRRNRRIIHAVRVKGGVFVVGRFAVGWQVIQSTGGIRNRSVDVCQDRVPGLQGLLSFGLLGVDLRDCGFAGALDYAFFFTVDKGAMNSCLRL